MKSNDEEDFKLSYLTTNTNGSLRRLINYYYRPFRLIEFEISTKKIWEKLILD